MFGTQSLGLPNVNDVTTCINSLVCSQLENLAEVTTVLLLSATTAYILGIKVLNDSGYLDIESCKEMDCSFSKSGTTRRAKT